MELYTLLKVKSRIGLNILEKVWISLHKRPTIEEHDSALSELLYSKKIKEEPWEIDSHGHEIIPSLGNKKFSLTNAGKKKLRKLKWLYLWGLLGRLLLSLLHILKTAWIIIAALVAFLGGLVAIFQYLESKGL